MLIVVFAFPFSIYGDYERRIGKRADNTWDSHFSFGRNAVGFEASVNFPDLSIVGALKSANGLGTATLVAPNFVITAAHVIKNDLADTANPSEWQFILHHTISEASSKDYYEIDEFFIHPAWVARQNSSNTTSEGDGDAIGVDLALVRLKRSVLDIFPAKLPHTNDDPLGKRSVISGFGTLVDVHTGQSDASNSRRTGAENIIDRSVAKVEKAGVPENETGGLLAIDFDSPAETDNNLSRTSPVIDYLGEGNSSATPLTWEASTALGDSGGPAFVYSNKSWRIHGVVSYGVADSTYGDITVYTRLASHYDWLIQNLPNWSDAKVYSTSPAWSESTWLGEFTEYSNDWYFSYKLGWIYIPSPKGNFFWGWSSLINQWIWMSDESFPAVSYYSDQNIERPWFFIDLNSSNSRSIRAYDYATKEWQAFPTLSQ